MGMSIDRLIVVRYPMAASRICTTARAKWTVAGTVVTVFTLNSNMLFIYKYSYNEATGTFGKYIAASR